MSSFPVGAVYLGLSISFCLPGDGGGGPVMGGAGREGNGRKGDKKNWGQRETGTRRKRDTQDRNGMEHALEIGEV